MSEQHDDFLKEAYRLTRKDSAPGVDKVTAAQYADNLEDNLRDALAMPGNSVEELDQREQVVNAVRSQLRVLNRS